MAIRQLKLHQKCFETFHRRSIQPRNDMPCNHTAYHGCCSDPRTAWVGDELCISEAVFQGVGGAFHVVVIAYDVHGWALEGVGWIQEASQVLVSYADACKHEAETQRLDVLSMVAYFYDERIKHHNLVKAAVCLQRNKQACHGAALAKAHHAVERAVQPQKVVVEGNSVRQPFISPHAVHVLVGVPVLVIGAVKDADHVLGYQSRGWVWRVDIDKLYEVCERGVEVGKLHLLTSK